MTGIRGKVLNTIICKIMSKGDSIHTFENGGKENSFFCMKLASFLQRDQTVGDLDPESFSELWKKRFEAAKVGSCYYREQCPIYHRTAKRGNVQLKLF
nr:MAG TPA: hypothetical protein [Caudoviricetes sp.]